MFYLIYLFTSLILICNSFVNCNEDTNKLSWTCVDGNCDTPISEFVTLRKYFAPDHNAKLRFDANQLGIAFKKPDKGNDYWFVQMGDNKGYIHKDFIRETKVLNKATLIVEDINPFVSNTEDKSFKAEITPSPTKPTVVDGTTIYDDDFSVSGDAKPLTPQQTSEETPPLAPQSTFNDNVEPNNTDNVPSETITAKESEVNTSDVKGNTDKPDESESRTAEPSPEKLGVSSVTSVDDYDDEDGLIEEEEDEDDDNVPSETTSTNIKENLNESNPSSNDENASDTPDNTQEKPVKPDDSNVDVNLDQTKPTDDQKTLSNPDVVTPPTDHIKSSIGTGPNEHSNASTETVADNPPDVVTSSEPIAETDSSNFDQTQSSVSSNNESQPTKLDEVVPDLPNNMENINMPGNTPEQKVLETPQIYDPYPVPMQNINQVKQDSYNSGYQGYEPGVNQAVPDAYNAVYPQNPNHPPANEVPQQTSESPTNLGSESLSMPSVDNTQEKAAEAKPSTETPSSFHYLSSQNNVNPANNPNNQMTDQTQNVPQPSSETVVNPNLYSPSTPESMPEQNVEKSVDPSAEINTSTTTEPKEETVVTNIDTPQPTTEPIVEPDDPNVPPTHDDVTSPIPQEEIVSTPSLELSNDQTKEEIVDESQQTEEQTGFYSSISSFLPSFEKLFSSSEPSENPPSESDVKEGSEVQEESSTVIPTTSTAPSGYCYDGESCGGLERPIGGEDHVSSYWSQPNINFMKESVPLSFNSILYICITSVVILLFSLGYYYIDKSQNSSHLIALVNKLNQELFVTKKERDTLEDQMLKIKENCNMMDTSKMKQDSKLSTLKKALEESESSRAQLEETVVRLEKEVETLMDQGMEMHKLLSETISDEERSQMLLANIDELKESLGEKLNEIVSLTQQLDQKNQEIQLKELDLKTSNDKLSEVERKLESCKSDSEEFFSKKLQDHQQQIIKLQQVLEEKGVSIAKLENELAKTKVERDSAEARASSAETGLQSAHSVGAGEARKAWLDATSIRAALVAANKTNETLQTDINQLNSTNKTLQDKMSSLQDEMSSLNSRYESAEKEKVNALTKLQVLSDYFKEKETKLEEELGMKESLWLQKESEGHTIYEQMKSLREEIASYKAQNDKLKAEILEQEGSYKVQIANEEQKSYDNWVALRQAERKIKELQMESAHFRNRLTQIETANQSSDSIGLVNPNGLDKSLVSAPSPPFMMLPPMPSSDFFPLPPPPIHPSASRPPPLGRISSPQLSGEMIPPPPLVPFDMYPPPSSSTPPPPPPIFKPQPRDRHPSAKDSPPSNYSGENSDKQSRRRRDRR